MRHVQWTVNEYKNMSVVPFPTRYRSLFINRTHLNCSYIWNVIMIAAVVVSAFDWNAGGPGLIPGCSLADTFGIRTNGQRLTFMNCAVCRAVPCTLTCLVYTLSRMSQIPLCHNTTVDLSVFIMAKHASASVDLKERKRILNSVPSLRLDQRCRNLVIRRARNEDGASAVL